MNKKAILLGVVPGALIGVCAALYQNGYWDTWADKKDALVAEVQGSLDPRMPEKARTLFSECVSDKLLPMADAAGCRLNGGPVQPQVVACLKPMHAKEASNAVLECIAFVQEQMDKDTTIK